MKDKGNCQPVNDGVERALAHLMPRSAGAIVREAFYGTTRFDDFLRRTTLPRSVLAAQLENLVRTGMLRKAPYRVEGERVRQGYHLTERGRALGVALIALIDWSRRWSTDGDEPFVEPVHIGCGAIVHTVLRCAAGHEDFNIDEVHAVATPTQGSDIQAGP